MKKTIEKENYLKSIYKLQEKQEDITVTALSIIFKVSRSTVSNMLKKLVKMGLVNTSPYKPIKLTALGRKKAVEIISKHSGRSVKDLQKDMDRDYFMTAQQALDYGIIDEIVMPKEVEVPA